MSSLRPCAVGPLRTVENFFWKNIHKKDPPSECDKQSIQPAGAQYSFVKPAYWEKQPIVPESSEQISWQTCAPPSYKCVRPNTLFFFIFPSSLDFSSLSLSLLLEILPIFELEFLTSPEHALVS